jgi:hypothetical protein
MPDTAGLYTVKLSRPMRHPPIPRRFSCGGSEAARNRHPSRRWLTAARTQIMNAISVIAPYKHHGMRVFDDPHAGLKQEPFVAGADTMIDWVVADIQMPP